MKLLLQFLLFALIIPTVELAHADALIPVLFHTNHGDVTVQAELALTPEAQEHGLMGRTSLPHGAGMLFPFDPPQPVTMWMKGTLIPLDMVFIGTDGHILHIAADAKPKDLTPIPSGGLVKAVLEIGGGEAARLGLKPGDAVNDEVSEDDGE